jgi:hypothetical protein
MHDIQSDSIHVIVAVCFSILVGSMGSVVRSDFAALLA